jgi:uridine phosphorylase
MERGPKGAVEVWRDSLLVRAIVLRRRKSAECGRVWGLRTRAVAGVVLQRPLERREKQQKDRREAREEQRMQRKMRKKRRQRIPWRGLRTQHLGAPGGTEGEDKNGSKGL